jgi:cohesin complex subunit SA-1/2
MNVASPLQSSAEDFLESLQQSPGAALAELINLILRSCGCNDSVDSDQAVDFDGIVSTLDDFTESLKQVHHSSLFLVTFSETFFSRKIHLFTLSHPNYPSLNDSESHYQNGLNV